MNVQTEVSIKTPKAPISDLLWCYCNVFSTLDHTVPVISHDESAAVFYQKGESLEEYWYCIMNDLIQPEDYGKSHSADLIFDDGGDMTILVHKGKKAGDLFLKDGNIHDPTPTGNFGFKIVQTIIKRQLEGLDTDKWNKIVNTCMGFYEETSTGVHHM